MNARQWYNAGAFHCFARERFEAAPASDVVEAMIVAAAMFGLIEGEHDAPTQNYAIRCKAFVAAAERAYAYAEDLRTGKADA